MNFLSTCIYLSWIESSTPVVYPIGPTARSHGRLYIKYWANRTAATTTTPDYETIHEVVENYLKHKRIGSPLDDLQLERSSGSSKTIHINNVKFLFLIIFIIFRKK